MARKSFANGFQFVNGKSLNEQISDVLASRKSSEEKYTDLLLLGLRDKEVQDFLHTSMKVRLPRQYRYYTFGVEIECFNAPRPLLVNSVTNKGVGIFSYMGCYSGCHADNHKSFKIVSDGSIDGRDSNEVVSPVLKSTNGMSSLKKVCEALNEIGAKVNRSCGLHVHIGAEGLTDEQYANVFKNYYYMTLLIETFLAPSRRGGCHWCNRLPSAIISCNSRSEVLDACHNDRYHVVNPCAYARHKTIEFRQHQGSTDFEKIKNWVHFCAKLVEWSKANVLDHVITSVGEIPFLSESEKRFFKGRQAHFARVAA